MSAVYEEAREQKRGQDLVGSHISHYTIRDRLGSGVTSDMYQAHDDTLWRNVVVKVVRRDPSVRDYGHQLAHEVQALSRVNHSHVAGVYDFFSDSGLDYIVMEFVSGLTLKSILKAGPLPMPEVLRLGAQILDGLNAAHLTGVIHGDLKPANIKVTELGTLKIVDFGLATLTGGVADTSTLTAAMNSDGRLAGSVPYMSPERLLGLDVDQRSDIYSVGALLYAMATGRPPFPETRIVQLFDAILHERPHAPSRLNPRVPRSFEAVIARALHKTPSQRFQTAESFAAAWKNISD